MKGLILLLVFFLIVSGFLISSTKVKSQTDMFSVSTTVKISVCGDGVVEGTEDCDGENLAGSSCSALGFGGGELVCDVGCEFDKADCLVETPAPTPTPTSNSTVESSASDLGLVAEIADSAEPVSVPVRIIEEVLADLPISVTDYDLDDSGSLELREFREVVETWVRVMRRREEGLGCDFNDDNICNIIDFSILLYYVGR